MSIKTVELIIEKEKNKDKFVVALARQGLSVYLHDENPDSFPIIGFEISDGYFDKDEEVNVTKVNIEIEDDNYTDDLILCLISEGYKVKYEKNYKTVVFNVPDCDIS